MTHTQSRHHIAFLELRVLSQVWHIKWDLLSHKQWAAETAWPSLQFCSLKQKVWVSGVQSGVQAGHHHQPFCQGQPTITQRQG